ncbi:MAG: signal peptidase II [Candidatus Peribacteraceae bacterium]|jgi:signal peptidase II|nr:signal peptidase II [Candidatus Peribacteraceae bacterium]HCI04125.1 signal peptidase II [Candidatus Peribacteria bacterium]|tara:strand:+ start:5127 stop:5558 length:432 start_codon:yes stop_codon:yes gene_type:complete
MSALFSTIIVASALSLGFALLVDQFLVERIAIIGSFIGLERTLNSGVAFGINLPEHFQMFVIFLALFFVAWYASKDAKTNASKVGFGLIIGGGLANIIDRLLDGTVTDFFQVGSFPVFNAADSCITVGIIMLFIDMVVIGRKK